jgi:hypothetical protein
MGCLINQELTLGLLSKMFAMSRAVSDMKDDSIPLKARKRALDEANAACVAAYNAVRDLRETCPSCANEEKLRPLKDLAVRGGGAAQILEGE